SAPFGSRELSNSHGAVVEHLFQQGQDLLQKLDAGVLVYRHDGDDVAGDVELEQDRLVGEGLARVLRNLPAAVGSPAPEETLVRLLGRGSMGHIGGIETRR